MYLFMKELFIGAKIEPKLEMSPDGMFAENF